MTRTVPAQVRGTTAVVPLRDGVSGKSRLAAVLDAGARRRLVRVLARHVVTTLLAADGIERVVVVTADPVFTRETLARLDVEVLEQPADRPGLNAALEHARSVLSAAGPADPASPAAPQRLLIAHADLPALTPADVNAILAEDAPVVIATDRNRSGTNLLLLPSAALPFESEVSPLSGPAKRRNFGFEGEAPADRATFGFRFGVGSLAAHLDEADRLGLGATVVQRPGTAVDLDTADDWSQLPDEVRAAVGAQVPGLL
ncbi:NTP transferase domain-containing protein [Promicromonospora sp. Populi]|uniref:NTP transferase domain-containing protein n=1 Tax=Promicromonospora sp. Populi TaxID=3239420 RepID=UPI0034E22B20